MKLTVIIRTLGLLFLVFSTTLVPPAIVSIVYDDGELMHFAEVFALTIVAGLALWLPLSRRPYTIRNRDGFVIVALMWSAMSVLGSLPFVLALDMDLADALFESASGFTTTGSTVILGLDALAPSILFYRQEIQWVGGIGVIVLAVALMPMLGVGGMQLYKAETPGPVKDERLTPRIARTAQTLCVLYVGMTIACALSFWLAGMDAFEAIAHSLTTLSTGGFSTHDASLAYFDSVPIEAVAVVFMLLGGISFNAHFIVWRTLTIAHYARDEQVRTFLVVVLLLSAATAVMLFESGETQSLSESTRFAVFEVVSVITSTGYGIADFSVWPLALPVILIFASFMGGCAGSTAGGMKVIRFIVVAKQANAYIDKLVHPRAVRPIFVDDRVVESAVVDGVWGFFTIYVIVFGLLMMALMMSGVDQVTAFGAIATCMNNLGPGLGEVAANFTTIEDGPKLILVLAMLLGRLEIFTILVLLTPAFWKA